MSFLKRYALLFTVAGYMLWLAALHALGRFPQPGFYDLSRLIGIPVVTLEGTVLDFPLTRWNQTRFLMEGHALPLNAFHGRVVVTLPMSLPELAPGERLRVRGWLKAPRAPTARRPFDEQSYWAGRGTYALLQVWDPDTVTFLSSPRVSFPQVAWRFHQRFKQFWYDALPNEDEAALISGITVGARGVLRTDLKQACIRAGVYHILVISGQQVALVVTFAIACLGICRIPRRWTFWLCLPPILFYAYVVGGEPPVVRASVMALVILGMMALGRDIPRFYPLALAAFWILLREPEAFFGASFQLSFGATASLLLIFPWLRQRISSRNRILRWWWEAGSMSLAVHLGIWPVLVYYFHQISVAGLVANWTLFPLSGGILVLGLILGTCGVFFPALVPIPFITAMHFLLKGLLWSIQNLGEARYAAIPCAFPPWPVCALYYGLLFCILLKIHVQDGI